MDLATTKELPRLRFGNAIRNSWMAIQKEVVGRMGVGEDTGLSQNPKERSSRQFMEKTG
jgi:hypothetical protein